MSKIKKIIVGTAVAIAALGVGAGAASADDGSGACVTRYEYSQVRRGMTEARVARVFGTNGRVTSPGFYARNREYRGCASSSTVPGWKPWIGITFARSGGWQPYGIYSKYAVW